MVSTIASNTDSSTYILLNAFENCYLIIQFDYLGGLYGVMAYVLNGGFKISSNFSHVLRSLSD